MNMKRSMGIVVFGIIVLGGYQNCSSTYHTLDSSSPPAQTQSKSVIFACDLAAFSGQQLDASAALQKCLNEAPAQSTVTLPPGRYLIAKTIVLNTPVTVATAGKQVSQGPCEASDTHTCAELRASPALDSDPNQNLAEVRGILNITSTGAGARQIVLNGNRAERLQTLAGQRCRAGDNGRGVNLQVTASHVTVEGIVSKNVVCGTAFAITHNPSHLMIRQNVIAFNGDHSQEGLWADGLTVQEAHQSQFIGNRFIDNTDIDLIFGGCPNCVIQANTITHTNSFAGSSFGALMLHAWPNATSGDYTGADISQNQIDCGNYRCGFGINLGSVSWYQAPYFGGAVHHNTVKGAMQGINLDFSSGPVALYNNSVTRSGGHFWTACGFRSASSYNLNPKSQVDRSQDTTPLAKYTSYDWQGCIPNFWTQDSSSQGASMACDPQALRDRSPSGRVAYAYCLLLGRSVDSGSSGWTEALEQGHMNSAQLIGRIVGSPEFEKLYGVASLNHQTYALMLYRVLLQRDPNAAELAGWTSSVQSQSRIDVATSMAESAEFKTVHTW